MPAMKSLLQNESAQCGLACLAMVLDHHGYEMDALALQREFPASHRGATLADLIESAHAHGMQCRAMRIELEDIRHLQTPCILHWDLDHFVVLARADGKRVVIHDPALGVRRLRLHEMSAHFTGVALELSPTTTFVRRALSDDISLRHMVGQVTGLKRAAAQILGLSLILQLFGLLSPLYMQWVLDDVLAVHDYDLLWTISAGYLILLAISAAIAWLRSWCLAYLSAHVGMQWFGSIFAHMLRLPMAYFQKRHLGDVVSRMESVHAIQGALGGQFIEALLDGVMIVIAAAVMVSYDWRLLLISVIAIALYLLLRMATFPTIRRLSEEQMVAGARRNTHLLESIRGVQALKLNVAESMRRGSFDAIMAENANIGLRTQKFGLSVGFANQMLFGSERVIVVALAAWLVLQGHMTAGMLVAYLAYKDMFTGGISRLIDLWISLKTLRVQSERLADVVLTEPEQPEPPRSAPLPRNRPLALEVQGLRYRFDENGPWIVDDCRLAVAPGETVAIVGPTGCGKTTLLKLMVGLITPDAGRVLVDGRSLTEIDLRHYRRAMGVVMQDDQLFAGSIMDNIAFGHDAPDPAAIETAARLAAIHDEIERMPMRYHTLIGDMGAALSGGQKQRIILARALFRKPQVLFLDEATSHLDVATERAVNASVAGVSVTRILIAHRPETIASADRVLMMEAGRIVREFRPREAGSEAPEGITVAQRPAAEALAGL